MDPTHGPLWGAALVCGAVLSVAIEAVWSTKLWMGCIVVAFAAVDYLFFLPTVMEDLLWNAYFPIPFLIAAIVLAWVVSSQSVGWWPVLVFVGSVAAQTHLIFTITSVLLVLVAPCLGLAQQGRPARWRWLVMGFAVAAICWIAPIIQDFGRQGNLTALLHSGHGKHLFGFGFGLRMVAFAGSPAPLWLHHGTTNFFALLMSLNSHSPVLGAICLVALAVIGIGAWFFGRRSLSALSLVTLTCSVGTMITFASIPSSNSLNLIYVDCSLWAVSILIWTVGVWTVGEVVLAALRRRANLHVDRHLPQWTAAVGMAGIGVVVLFGLVGATDLSPVGAQGSVGLDAGAVRAIGQIATQVQDSARPGPVALTFNISGGGYFSILVISEGVAWKLESDGWKPGLYNIERVYTGLDPVATSKAFLITVRDDEVVSVHQIRCSPLPEGCTKYPLDQVRSSA